ncbi:hypothetical protein [Methylocystis suflitae]|uniref:hypothetical protein n=1 Tax=Methylocystis suflitae TaxID=2951405 RepID=UPI00210D0D56|nr:hypothetical protein [Methylocystis suflitae]MCQ4188851.1 hypothetical protein [Methylocystis suflitae]
MSRAAPTPVDEVVADIFGAILAALQGEPALNCVNIEEALAPARASVENLLGAFLEAHQ